MENSGGKHFIMIYLALNMEDLFYSSLMNDMTPWARPIFVAEDDQVKDNHLMYFSIIYIYFQLQPTFLKRQIKVTI